MLILQFLVTAVVSMIDPLLIAFYVVAALLASTWRRAAGTGSLAGILIVGLSLALSAADGWQPKPLHLAAQLAACILGAMLVRAAINAFRGKAATA